MIALTLIGIFLAAGFVAFLSLPLILDLLIEKSTTRGFHIGPWKTHFGIGCPSTKPLEKAALARVGLGGNSVEETIYWNAFTDDDGDQLYTKENYEIEVSNPLPVNHDMYGFWSITAYGSDQYLLPNDLKEYTVRSIDFEASDYPVTIRLSGTRPDVGPFIHLGKKEQKFSLALRCYRPMQEMKTPVGWSKIELPKIKKVT